MGKFKAQHRLIIPSFASEGPALRRYFDQQFQDPRHAHPGRFVWDYWHVPGQYTLLRTPAYHYFPKALYEKFHRRLVAWGRANLGCHDISPPWLSCYIDGCEQELHRDEPHGPLAFVYSLTNWLTRKFTGGETFILKDLAPDAGRRDLNERDSLMTLIAPHFNQLALFDPSQPHGVRPVRGVQDPRQGRLVIHGWFVKPRPFVEGALRPQQIVDLLPRALRELSPLFADVQGGVWTLRLVLSKSGKVIKINSLINTMRSVATPHQAQQRCRQAVGAMAKWRFPAARGRSSLTLPLNFDAQL